ncbi:MAG: hypothetical protein Alpg2KO_17400 [Alphaproteobacteria bacterium]
MRNYFNNKQGVTASSYGLVVGLIAIVALAATTQIGGNVNSLFGTVDNSLTEAAGQSESSPSALPSASPLFSFSSHTFTTCGQTGRTGPDLTTCRSAYSTTWDEDNANFNMTTNGIQRWTVPETATYRITASGAQGAGNDPCSGCGSSLAGAEGAVIEGEFDMNEGDILQILVGQQGLGRGGPHGNENGGGGGTFVVDDSNNAIIIAGGGGGGPGTAGHGQSCVRSTTWGHGQSGTGTLSFTCNVTMSSRTGPDGGLASTSNGGAAGGGLTGNGANGGAHCNTSTAGQSFTNGGVGGNGLSCYTHPSYPNHDPDGGFGGGGAGDLASPGGGGGYAGGSVAASWSQRSTYGGGGSSFNSGLNPNNSTGGNTGHGSVVIEKLP